MVILPLIIVWFILNILDGYFQDIFYGLLAMNWVFGLIMFLIARSIMIKTFKEEKKSFLYFLNMIYKINFGEVGERFKPEVC